MEKTNLIFLDIDGVLNSEHFYQITPYYTWDLFDPVCVILLNKLIKENNAFLIISSDWRKTYGISQIRDIFKQNKIKGTIIDCTSIEFNKEKGINEYLKKLSKKLKVNYIVLDDEKLNINNLVQTNLKYGFSFKDYEKASKILNNNK